MNSQAFHAHFFLDEAGRWCLSVRAPDGSRTSPRVLTAVQIYQVLPWVESLGIRYKHLVGDERDVELWLAQAFERLEDERARARLLERWEIGLWWAGIFAIAIGSVLLGMGVATAAVVVLFLYFPISLSRDVVARSAARQYDLLRPMISSFKPSEPK